MDLVEGHLEIGIDENGDVVINIPPLKKKRDQHKTNCAYRGNTEELCDCEIEYEHIIFSPDQARKLARNLLEQAAKADGFPSLGSDDEFFIDFDTEIEPGKIQAVRINISLVTIRNMEKPINIALCSHPLFKELKRYVKANNH
jgi:hypothetical protein